MNKESYYRADEIKYKVDHVIQKAMYDTYKNDNKDEIWNFLLDLQSRFYDIFELED